MKARLQAVQSFLSAPVVMDLATFMFCSGMLLGMAVCYAAVLAAAG